MRETSYSHVILNNQLLSVFGTTYRLPIVDTQPSGRGHSSQKSNDFKLLEKKKISGKCQVKYDKVLEIFENNNKYYVSSLNPLTLHYVHVIYFSSVIDKS